MCYGSGAPIVRPTKHMPVAVAVGAVGVVAAAVADGVVLHRVHIGCCIRLIACTETAQTWVEDG